MKIFSYVCIPLIVSIIAGFVYLFTAAPAMLWVDAGDMISAASTFGVNDPPAPLYVFIAHFFTLLPFGSIIFRLQIFSALTASASLFLLYQIIVQILSKDKKEQNLTHAFKKVLILAGIFSIFALAFSYEFWSQAQNTDRFVLALFIEVFILYLIIANSTHNKSESRLYLIVFLCGIAYGIDPVVVSFYPAVLILLWHKRSVLSIKKLFFLCLTGLAGIILVMSYLPLATLHNPFLDVERPTTLGRIWALITGLGQNYYNPETGAGNGFTGSAHIFFSSSWHYLVMVWQSFTPIILPFILCGGWYVWRNQKWLFGIFTSILITNFILSDLYLSGNQESWYLMSDAVFALFAGLGYFWIMSKFHYRWFAMIFILVSFAPLAFWWTILNRHDWLITKDYIDNFYKPIHSPSIIYGTGDNFANATIFVHVTTTDKPEVIPIVDGAFDIVKQYRVNLALTTNIKIPNDSALTDNETPQIYSKFVNDFFAMNISRYNIYITYPALSSGFIYVHGEDNQPSFTLDTKRFKLIPQGMMEEVVLKNSTEKPKFSNFNYQFSNGYPLIKPVILEKDPNDELAEMLNEYISSYLGLGDYLLTKGNDMQAVLYYNKAYLLNANNIEVLNKLGLYYSNNKHYKKALNYYLKEHTLAPFDPQITYNIGVALYDSSKDMNQAKYWFTRTLSLAKYDPRVMDEAANALKSLSIKIRSGNTTSNTASNVTNPTPNNSWQTFNNTQMNLTFSYPPGYETQTLGTDVIGLFANGQADPIITFYSAQVSADTNLDTFAKTFPYAINGTFIAEESTPLDGFQQVISYEYSTEPKETELVLLKQDTQIIALTIPLTKLNDQAFGNMITQIVLSIKLLQ